uniref:DUF5710 domain-containing protein n=1 Tax=viral metagenome TaxID=1070528 RepID=A0A6C0JP41_9ZZZZ
MKVSIKILSDDSIELSGGTFDVKDEIKSHNGKWNPATKKWVLPKGTNTDFLFVKTPAPIYIPTYGHCCSKSKIMEEYLQGPSYIQCDEHGKRPTTSKGFGYTGD